MVFIDTPEPSSVGELMERYRASRERLDADGSIAAAKARAEALATAKARAAQVAESERQAAENDRRAKMSAAQREEEARLRLIRWAERQALLVQSAKTPPRDIIKRVAVEHRLRPEEITGESRRLPIVRARHAAMAAIYVERPDLSLPQIGRAFGKDHTTVLSALQKLGVCRKAAS